MELKLPPVVVFLVFGAVMYLLGTFMPFGLFDFFGRMVLSKTLLGMAMIIIFIAIVQFKKAKTTTDPSNLSKVSRLVTTGIYQFSRNPMYLAMLLILLALGLKLGNAFNALTAAGFVAYMNRFQIIPEENTLLNKFGKEYKLYCTLVRRWF
ncbi:methyltransferase family protein [Maribacter sp. 2304DJ31-5]|uniref:methyltransferase family protein n=1 Tax=Maribacter sp. 2304DJ31-5 TaxID=3386273 RepID=UPI0039BD5B61